MVVEDPTQRTGGVPETGFSTTSKGGKEQQEESKIVIDTDLLLDSVVTSVTTGIATAYATKALLGDD